MVTVRARARVRASVQVRVDCLKYLLLEHRDAPCVNDLWLRSDGSG